MVVKFKLLEIWELRSNLEFSCRRIDLIAYPRYGLEILLLHLIDHTYEYGSMINKPLGVLDNQSVRPTVRPTAKTALDPLATTCIASRWRPSAA